MNLTVVMNFGILEPGLLSAASESWPMEVREFVVLLSDSSVQTFFNISCNILSNYHFYLYQLNWIIDWLSLRVAQLCYIRWLGHRRTEQSPLQSIALRTKCSGCQFKRNLVTLAIPYTDH